MRVVVVGLGVQGHKRRRVAGADCRRRSRSGQRRKRDYRDISDVPLDRYDAALAVHARRAQDRSCSRYLRRQRQACAGREAVVRRQRRASSPSSRRWRASTRRVLLHRLQPSLRAALRAHARSASHPASSARSTAAACSTATARRGWCAIPRGAIRVPACFPISARTCSTPAGSGSATSATDFRVVSASRFENRAPDHVVIASAKRRARARAGDDAAIVAQSLHLRHARREGHRAHRVAVQVGADHVHAAHAHPAERTAA